MASEVKHQQTTAELALAEKQSAVNQLQLQLAKLHATHAASSNATPAAGPTMEDVERWTREWKEKYRELELENARLRDRSLRSERLLSDMQGTSTSSNLRRHGSFMDGVTTLPWLASKEEDPEDRSMADLDLLPSGQRPRGLGSVKFKYLLQSTMRQAMRQLDRQRLLNIKLLKTYVAAFGSDGFSRRNPRGDSEQHFMPFLCTFCSFGPC
jgi:hypothetical protein